MHKRITTCLALALVTLAGTAQAEHKLLATEVLAAKQVEIHGEIGYQELKRRNVSVKDAGAFVTGKLKEANYSGRLAAGLGLGHGLELSVAAPYLIEAKEQFTSAAGRETDVLRGFGDLTVAAKYKASALVKAPVDITLGLAATLPTAAVEATGPRERQYDLAPSLAIAKKLGRVTPYAVYTATLFDLGSHTDHQGKLGAEIELSHRVTLDLAASAAHHSTAEFRPYHSGELELGSYIELGNNVYLTPKLNYEYDRAHRAVADDERLTTGHGFGGSLGLYWLF